MMCCFLLDHRDNWRRLVRPPCARLRIDLFHGSQLSGWSRVVVGGTTTNWMQHETVLWLTLTATDRQSMLLLLALYTYVMRSVSSGRAILKKKKTEKKSIFFIKVRKI